MINSVQYLGRTLSVEVLKCRRTLVFWLTAGAPFFMVFLVFNIFYFKGHQMIGPTANPWAGFLGMIGDMWGFFFFPMYITLQSVLLLSVEHQANTWKHVYSLAIPRWTVYFSKLVLSVGLVAFCMIMLYVFTELGGLLLSLLRPELKFGKYNASLVTLKGYTKLFLAGLGIVGIQHFISFRYPNFILPAAFGLAMTITAIALIGQAAFDYIPYAFPALSVKGDTMQYVPVFNREVYLSLVVFAVASFFGGWLISRRNVE